MKNFRTQLLASAAVLTLSGGAYAADMGVPVKAPPAPAPIPYTNWQGFYIGGHIGVAASETVCSTTQTKGFGHGGCQSYGNGVDGGTANTNFTAIGVAGGGQVGYDWQSRYFVYGVVADWTATNLRKSFSGHSSCLPFANSKIDWLASFRGRMGLAVDDTLVYVTGGLALAGVKGNAGQVKSCPCTCFNNSVSKVAVGAVGGVGVEHKFNPNWSGFVEALYYGFDKVDSGSVSNTLGTYTTEFTPRIFETRVGLNYRF